MLLLGDIHGLLKQEETGGVSQRLLVVGQSRLVSSVQCIHSAGYSDALSQRGGLLLCSMPEQP